MQRIVLTFGLIAGAIFSAMMFTTAALIDEIGFDKGEILGYTTMVLAFLMVYFGIRSYRETTPEKSISFGRAFKVGILITLVASTLYVASWEIIYCKVWPDFGDKYASRVLEKEKATGATAAQLEVKAQEMARFKELYKNPFFNVGMTLLEPFPVGLIITLVSAALLRRRNSGHRSYKAIPTV
ncbi:MAG: DUF4199 domain-containing protein [Gemmatimonadota bacterium]